MESGAFQLVMLRGPQPEKVFNLTKDTIAIGRESANDIIINDPEVSRQHARLIRQDEAYIMEDLGSTNGTFINGTRTVGPNLLSDGDEIDLGETVSLVYKAPVSAALETIVSPGAVLATSLEPEPVEPEPEPEPAEAPPLFDAGLPAEVPPPPFDAGLPAEPEPVFEFEAEPEPEEVPLPPPFPTEPEFGPELPAFVLEPEPEPIAPPPPFEPEPAGAPPPPTRPPTMATAVTPPPMAPPAEPEKPKSRKNLMIGCGCLLLLVICAITLGFAYLIWNAPPEFFDDPLGNFDKLFGMILPLLYLI